MCGYGAQDAPIMQLHLIVRNPGFQICGCVQYVDLNMCDMLMREVKQSISGSRLDLLYMFCARFCFQFKVHYIS